MRCYSVTRQAKDQDPKGEFIKQYVPELRGLDVKFMHEPWKMKPPPPGYCRRIVDEAKTSKASKTTIAALQKQFQSGGCPSHMTAPLTTARSASTELEAVDLSDDQNEHLEVALTESQSAHGIQRWLNAKRPRLDSTSSGSLQHSGPWSCPQCTLLNDAKSVRCEACDGPRVSNDTSLAGTSTAFISLSSHSKPWSCSRCTLLNDASRSHCDACDAQRPTSDIPIHIEDRHPNIDAARGA